MFSFAPATQSFSCQFWALQNRLLRTESSQLSPLCLALGFAEVTDRDQREGWEAGKAPLPLVSSWLG